MLSSKLARCLFAGRWFAVAAAIPVGFYILIFLMSPFTSGTIYRIFTTIVTILAAGVVGLWLGADILDEKKTKSAWQAVGRGLAIAALSYLLFFIITLIAVMVYNSDRDRDELYKGIEIIASMFLIGLGLLGWLIAIVGVAAGGLLYLFRIKMMKPLEDGKEV